MAAEYLDGLKKAEAEIAKLRAEREELIKAGNVMRRFIMSWRDCLDGVQMSEASFIRDCGIDRWNRALAEKGGVDGRTYDRTAS